MPSKSRFPNFTLDAFIFRAAASEILGGLELFFLLGIRREKRVADDDVVIVFLGSTFCVANER